MSNIGMRMVSSIATVVAMVFCVVGCSFSFGNSSPFTITKNEFNGNLTVLQYCIEGKYTGDQEVTLVLIRSVDGGALERVEGQATSYSNSFEDGTPKANGNAKHHNTFQTLKKNYRFEFCDYYIRDNSVYRLVIWESPIGYEHLEKLRVVVESERIRL